MQVTSHNFFVDDLAFLAGVDFGASRTFGAGLSVTGAQNWDDEVHTFGKDPFFNGNVNFADAQVFPEGASFAAGQDFEAGETYTFDKFMDFAGGETFAAARDFGAHTVFSAKSDVGKFRQHVWNRRKVASSTGICCTTNFFRTHAFW